MALCLSPGLLAAQQRDDLAKVTLQLRWEYQFQSAGFITAKEMGYYRDAGLEVEVRELHYGMSVYDELTSGRAQYAVGTTDAIVQRANGTPVVALAVIFQHSPFVILSRKEAGIRSPEDLVGRKLAIYERRTTILEAMLRNEGVDPGRIHFVPYDEGYEGIVSGEVPATTAVLTSEPYVFEQLGIPYSIMYPQTYGIDFYGSTLITLESEVREHPARVRAFREASLRGWEYALENPEEIIDLIVAEYTPGKERALLEFEAASTVDLIHPDLIEIGHMNPGRWKRIADEYRNLGIIDNGVALERFLYDPNPIPDISGLWRTIGLLSALIVLVSVVAVTLNVLNVRLKRAQAEKQAKIEELEVALSEIKTLRDMLPICSSCKKIRDDQGYWENVETYILKHTSTVFSHGLCPDCVRKLYGDEALNAIHAQGRPVE